jgi:hypothetical protein
MTPFAVVGVTATRIPVRFFSAAAVPAVPAMPVMHEEMHERALVY